LQVAAAGRQEELPRKLLKRRAFAGGVKGCGKCGRSALKFLLGKNGGWSSSMALGSSGAGALWSTRLCGAAQPATRAQTKKRPIREETGRQKRKCELKGFILSSG
jgi:hypothetical protein